jgi:alkylation response protein AidB-like acyl-CoA dehydrogenase
MVKEGGRTTAMDFDFTETQQAFRQEVRTWLEANVPPELRGRGFASSRADLGAVRRLREWQRTLYKAGYVGMDWPAEYGGRGASLVEQVMFYEEMSRAQAPQPLNRSGVSMLGPTLMKHGTAAQKARHLDKILTAEEIWCQGFSEPNAGSDLANLQTRAVLDGDWYVLNGQKVWTSMAHVSDWGFFLVRTDPAAAKHKGITFLLLDMKSPGITIRPLRQITGEAEFNEVFLENVRVPASNVVGKVNEGWGVAITTLSYERDVLTMIRHISLRTALERLIALARRTKRDGHAAAAEPVIRQKLAGLMVAERCLQLNGYRSLTKILKGGAPGPEGSTSKLFWSQVDQDLAEIATEVIGPYSQIAAPSPWAVDEGQWEFYCCLARGSGIRAGTTEILRNILGERVLGLPKD